MPAVPPTTQYLGLPRLAADDHTRLWEHHNAVVDGIDGALGAWIPYTPVWSQSNGSVLSVGNGTLEGRYKRLGRTVFVVIRLERGTTSNQGSDNWIFSLPPIPPRAWNMMGGSMAALRSGKWSGGAVFPVSSGHVGALCGDLGRLSHAIPSATHSAGDWYTLFVTYEAAS